MFRSFARDWSVSGLELSGWWSDRIMLHIWQEASTDGSFIASLVQTVQRDLKAEILCVNNFIRLQSEFRIMRAGMEAWLDRKPSVDKLLENRQVLRSLKSKLRHKLADKHDAEEVGTYLTGRCEFCTLEKSFGMCICFWQSLTVLIIT